MERQPYYQPGESGGKDSKDKKPSGGFNIAQPPAFRSEAPRPIEPRHVPAAPVIEGVISWREQAEDDRRNHPDYEAEAAETDKKKGRDDNEGDGKTSTKRQPTQPQPVERPATPRPIAEAVAEAIQSKEAVVDQFGLPLPPEPVESIGVFPPVVERTEQMPTIDDADQEREPSLPTQYSAEAHPVWGQQSTEPIRARNNETPYTNDEVPPDPAEGQIDPTSTTTQSAQAFGTPNSAMFNQQPATASFGPNVNPNAVQFNPAAPNQQPAAPNMPIPGLMQNQMPVSFAINPNAAPVPAAVNIGGNQPPIQPGYNANQGPYNAYNPLNPNVTGYGYDNPNTPTMPPVMPIERPHLSGTPNRDPRVGPIAALLGLEYLARRCADRKLEKRINKRSEDQFRRQEQTMVADQRRLQEQQRQFATEQQRQNREVQRMQYANTSEPQPAATVGFRPFESAPTGAVATSQPVERPMKKPAQRQEFAPNSPYGQTEHAGVSGVGQSPEQRMQQLPTVEQTTSNSVDNGQEVATVQPGQHVEHSAWHNIVVDERGHEVAGAIRYGEGFQRERQQEAIRDRVAGGQAVGGGSNYAQQDQYGNPMLPSGMTNPTLPQGQSMRADPQHQLPATNKQPSNFTNPWFWIMLLLIIAAFFTAALV